MTKIDGFDHFLLAKIGLEQDVMQSFHLRSKLPGCKSNILHFPGLDTNVSGGAVRIFELIGYHFPVPVH